MRWQHKYGHVSTLLKFLSVLSLIVAGLNTQTILFAIRAIPYLYQLKEPFGPNYVISLWFFIGFLLCVFVAGILDKPKFLYLFPIFAYLHLIFNLSWLFSILFPFVSITGNYTVYYYHEHLNEFRLLIYIIMLITGLFTLAMWHKNNNNTLISSKVALNLRKIIFVCFIVLILNCIILCKDFNVYLQETSGGIPSALYLGGLRDIVVWVIMIVFCLKKWTSILWLFPIITLNFMWFKLETLILNPSSLSWLNVIFIYISLFLVIKGLVTLAEWISENRNSVKN